MILISMERREAADKARQLSVANGFEAMVYTKTYAFLCMTILVPAAGVRLVVSVRLSSILPTCSNLAGGCHLLNRTNLWTKESSLISRC